MRRLCLVILLCLSALAVAQDPNEPVRGPTTMPFSSRPQRDYSPEAIAAQREAAKEKAEQLAAERKARHEKLAAEYAESELPPAADRPNPAQPFFIFGGIIMLAMASVIIVYSRYLKPGR